MNEDIHIHEEIAAGEAWMREVSVEPDPPNMAQIMLRVQVAIDERWLAQRLEDDCPAAVANRVGVAVAESVSSQLSRRRRRIVRQGNRRRDSILAAQAAPSMSKGSVTLSGYIDVPPERMDDIQAALPTHIALSREEPGCLSFDVTPCPEVSGRFLVAETFVDQQAFDGHQARTKASDWARVTEGIARDYSVAVEG